MPDVVPLDTISSRSSHLPPNQHETDSETTIDHENATPITEKQADVPPDGGYGWVCVACNFFINAHTWGVNSSYAVFLAYYLSHDLFPNTSALAYAFIGGLSISQAMFIAPLATHIIHLFGTKVCLYLGVFFETLSLIGASFCTELWQLVLSQGICFGWGMGFMFVGSVGIISQWFGKKRSVANAVAAAGSGLGGFAYSLGTQRMIDNLGLPWAFRIIGICVFVVNLTASTLLKDRNKQTGSRHRAFDLALLKRPEFWLLQGWSFFSMLGYVIILFSVAAYARAIGLSATQGSIIGAILNLGQMAGRPFIGLASDRFGRINVATICTLLCGIFVFVFWIPTEVAPNPFGLLVFFVIVGGALAGTYWATIAVVGAEVFGIPDLPAALSWTWMFIVLPTTFAEPIALEMRRTNAKTWIYLPPQIFAGVMYVSAALCLWIVRGWKNGQLEELAKRENQAVVQESMQQAAVPGGSEEDKSIATATAHTTGDAQLQQLARARTNSVVAGSWNGRDLLRRMIAIKRI